MTTAEILSIGIVCGAAALFGGTVLSALVNKLFGDIVPPISSLAWIIGVVLVLPLYLALQPAMRGKMSQALDSFSPSIALGIVFGRLGCFSAGCCYGKPAGDLPWAVTFGDSHPFTGIPLHPTQLYEATGALVILSLLLGLRKTPAFKGSLIWIFLSTYGLLRFVVEFYRGSPTTRVGPFSLAQVVCAIFILLGSVMTMVTIKRNMRASKLPAS